MALNQTQKNDAEARLLLHLGKVSEEPQEEFDDFMSSLGASKDSWLETYWNAYLS